MLTQEDDVELHALAARGWTVSAIARHTGRDRKTVRRYLAGEGGRQRPAARPRSIEPWVDYIRARFEDDPHVLVSVLYRELVDAGYEYSYSLVVKEIRRRALRPVCERQHRKGQVATIELAHPPGEELQLDWLELRETP
jgi:transposase